MTNAKKIIKTTHPAGWVHFTQYARAKKKDGSVDRRTAWWPTGKRLHVNAKAGIRRFYSWRDNKGRFTAPMLSYERIR